MARASLLLLAAVGASGCSGARPAGTGPAPVRSAAAAPEQKPPAGREPAGLPPPTHREAALARELARDVAHLAVDIGERSGRELWNQASTTDYLAGQLEAAGHTVRRLGYALQGEETAQNLEVQIPGGELGYQILVVGAHYDSAEGSPGANDNASGVAALLALARAFADVRPARTLRLVAFANQEAPFVRTPAMGSAVYAERVAAAGDRIAGVIVVESIGYYADGPETQQRPGVLQLRFPDTADFVAVVGNQGSANLANVVRAGLDQYATLPVEGGGFPDEVAQMGGADHWAFWQSRIPAVMVTDTGALRYPHHHAATDTPDRLDFVRMARVVAALERVVLDLANAQQPASRPSGPGLPPGRPGP